MIDIELRGGADSFEALATMLEHIASDLRAKGAALDSETRKEGPDARDPHNTYTFDYDLSGSDGDEEFPGFTGTTGHQHLHNGDEVTAFGDPHTVVLNRPGAKTVDVRNQRTGVYTTLHWSALS
jgi:hypothetical protein